MNAKTCNRVIVGMVASVIVLVSAVVANEVGGTSETVGEPYTATYTYCGAWAGAGAQHHCTLWLTGQERRIDTKVHGLWFETTSYKVL